MLKKIFIVFVIFIIVIILLGASISVYFLFNGRRIFVSEIEKNLGVKAEMSSIRLVFPASLVIENFKIDDYLKTERITVVPSILGFLKGDIVFNSILVEKPYLKVTRRQDGSFDFGIVIYKKGKIIFAHKKSLPKTDVGQEEGKKVSPEAVPCKQKQFYFDKLKAIDGTIEYRDEVLELETPFMFKFSGIFLDAFRQSILQPFRMQFNSKANLLTEQDKAVGDMNGTGWVDIISKDMDVDLKINNLQLVNFEPYYKRHLKRDIKSGSILLDATVTSSNNDLEADCHVEMSGVAFINSQEPLEVKDNNDYMVLAIDSMLTSQGGAIFDFSIRTKLDNPKFEHIKFKGSFFQSKMQDMLSHPQETADQIEAMSKQFKDIGKQFKQMFKTKE